MTKTARFSTFGLAIGLLAQLDAQTPQSPAPSSPVFRSGISYVELDASVLDRNRNPVRGLSAADFTVVEDGQPQRILTFTEVNVPDPESVPAAWIRNVTPDVQANDEVVNRRLVVILMDDGQIRLDKRQESNTKATARALVARLGPADVAAILFTRIQKASQDFTSDHAKLLNAIDTFTPGLARPIGPSNDFGFDIPGGGASDMRDYFFRNSLVQLDKVATYLAALPGRRKALFYLTVGYVPPPAGTFEFLQLQQIYRSARQANVNIYPIDPSGLGGVDDFGVAESSASGTGRNAGMNQMQEFLREVAENTGGVAIVNREDFDSAVPRILKENGSYYLLGYESPNLKTDGKLRKIELKVNRPDVIVRSRSGYFGPRANERAAAPAKPGGVPAKLATAIGALLPSAAIGMSLSAAPFAVPGRSEAGVAVTVGLRPDLLTDRNLVDDIDLYAVALKVDGTEAASTRQPFKIGVAWSEYELMTRLNLKPGRYQLRVSAQSRLRDKAGSVFTDLDVPEFSKEPLSLSGVVLHAEPGLPAPFAQGVATLTPRSPTTLRTFSRDQKVTVFQTIYQGGKSKLASVSLTTRIRRADGTTIVETTDTLAAAQFDQHRAANIGSELPIGSLPAGAYLLTVEGNVGPSPPVHRDVRFQVR